MDEWCATGEKIIPHAILKNDYHDFETYKNNLDIKEPKKGLVPSSVFFCLDEDRDIFLVAVDIRHYLNDYLLFAGGHIGDGVRPSERRKGIAARMIALALDECKKIGYRSCFDCLQ